MKILIPFLLMLLPLGADTLKLRNGTVMQGHFVAGDERSIWFQSGLAPADSYPLTFVESLSFGPNVPIPSSYSPASTRTQMKQSNPRITRKAMLNLREALWLMPAASAHQTYALLR